MVHGSTGGLVNIEENQSLSTADVVQAPPKQMMMGVPFGEAVGRTLDANSAYSAMEQNPNHWQEGLSMERGAQNSTAADNRKDTIYQTVRKLPVIDEGNGRSAPVQDARTTLWITNVPEWYNQEGFLSCLDDVCGFRGKYDFFYLPLDFETSRSVGYAFVNVIDLSDVPLFQEFFDGYDWGSSEFEPSKINYARDQGKEMLIRKWINSSIMDRPIEFQPLIFASSGPRRGENEPFSKYRHLGRPARRKRKKKARRKGTKKN